MKHLAGIFTTFLCAGLLGQIAAQCLSGYTDSLANTDPSSCYRFNGKNWLTDGVSWSQARQQCKSEGGDLAIITTKKELEFLTSIVNQTTSASVALWHVGLERSSGFGWVWVDGSPYDSSVVAFDVQFANGDYAVLGKNGKLQKVYSYSNDFYICERSKYTIASCDLAQGWNPTEDGASCLKFYSTSNVNFWKARTTCQSASGDLAVAKSEALNSAVAGKLSGTQTAWIGLTTALNTLVTPDKYAQWQWVDKTNLAEYTKWAQPSAALIAANSRNNTCASISRSGSWNVRACNLTSEGNKFVCQRGAGECPDGWLLYKNLCYLVGYKMSWLEANQDCVSRGANLVVFSDDTVQEYVNSVLEDFAKNNVRNIWIGYKQNGPQENFNAVVTSISTKTNWDVGQPVKGNVPYGCGRISTSGTGKWSSSTCADLNGYLCQSPKGRVVKEPIKYEPNPLQYCEVGWMQWNTQCYRVLRETSTYDGGKKLCEESQAKLAYIDDIDYQAFVTRLTESYKGVAYWIGLRKVGPGNYVWEQTEQKATKFLNLADGADDTDNTRQCVFMHGGVADQAGRWDFSKCEAGLPVICSKKPSLILPNPTVPPSPTGIVSTRCPSGWEEDGSSNFCYFFMRYDTTYTNALHGCRELGSELAYIHTIESMKFVASRIAGRNLGWWIGLNTVGSEFGYYSWSLRSEPIAFTNWKVNEPNPKTGDCVVVISQTGKWEFAPCSKSYNFVCQRVADIVYPTRPPVVYTTPTGGSLQCKDATWNQYTSNNNFCYKFVKGRYTWQEALDYCKNEVDLGNLVSISNTNEQLFVQLLAQQKALESGVNFTTIWTGMTDKLDSAYPRMVQYVWSDNTGVTYTHWLPREPSSSDKECVAMNAALDGQWYDLDCSTDRVDGFMCKAPPIAVSAPKVTTPPSGCPSNYKLAYEGKCFLINSVALVNFDKARQGCIAQSGTLLVLSNRQEQNYISVALSGSSVSTNAFWMGLSGTDGNWQWLDGTTPSFTNWDSGYTAPQTQTCVAITDSSKTYPGLWTLKQCTDELPYICQTNRVGWTRTTQRITSVNPRVCPTGWITRGSRCYLPVAESLSLSDAIDYCKTKHFSILASFLSVNDQAEVARNMSRFGAENAWIGFGKRDAEHGWQWLDGTPVLFEQWASNEPDNSDDTKSCAFMSYSSFRNDGFWISDSCTGTERNFICMRLTSDATLTTPTLPDTNGTEICNGTGWNVYGSYCYYLYQSSQPWSRGLDLCDGMKADLVSILSAEENLFVHQIARQDSHLFTWIGLNEIGYKGFYWTDNSPFQYTAWDSGAHDIDGPCVAMSINTGKWSNQHCDSKFSFVCKKPIEGMVTRPTTAPPTAGGCPADSVTYGKSSRCFKIVTNSKKSQSEAITDCQVGFGRARTLASFGDMTDLNFVISKLRNVTTVTQNAHIGLMDYSKIAGQPSFRWIDNSLLYFTNWDVNEPDVLPTTPAGSCVEMQLAGTSPGNWRVQKNCNYQQAYVCSMPKSKDYVTPADPNPCDTGYISYNEHCYFVEGLDSTKALSWAAANEACTKSNAHLVSIHDAFEQAAVTWAVLSSGPITGPISFWIGLNTNNAPETWEWSDEWPVDFTRWLPTEPSESTAKRCAAGVIRGVYASEAGDWASQDCRNKNAYVCRKTKAKPNVDDSTYVEGTCPSGWLSGISKCYLVNSTARVMWSEAILKCRALNGSFGAVDTVTDNQMLATELTRQKSLNGALAEDVWLGIASSGGEFAASDGSAVSYFNWGEGVQPLPGASQAAFMEQTSFWYLLDPNQKLGFVCKRTKDPKPTFAPIDPTRTSDQPDVFTKQPPVFSHEETYDTGVGLIVGICLSFVVVLAGLTVLLVYLKRKNMVPQKIDEIVSKSTTVARSQPSPYSAGPSSSGASGSSGLVGFENVTFEAPKDPSSSTVPKSVNSDANELADVNTV